MTTLSNPEILGTTLKLPIYSDLVSITTNLSDGKLRLGDVTSTADVSLGILNTALDPLGAILGSAVDYLMNLLVSSIKPLGDAVNWLLGDPAGITAVARSWQDAATEVTKQGNAFVGSLADVSQWQGAAADVYRNVVRHTHDVYQQAQEAAAGVAGWVTLAGGVVSVFREFMWGLLKDFITEIVKAAILALAAAIPTVGGSIAAFGTWFGARMAMMAGKFTKTLSKLMTKIGDLVTKLGKSGRAFYVAAEKLSQLAARLGRSASHGFGASGIPGASSPRLPGDITKDFKAQQPGVSKVKDVYSDAKRGTKIVDTAADAWDTAHPDPIDDLPAGY